MVTSNGKDMCGEQIYLQPLGAGLGGKQEPSEKILAEEGNMKGCPLSPELLRGQRRPLELCGTETRQVSEALSEPPDSPEDPSGSSLCVRPSHGSPSCPPSLGARCSVCPAAATGQGPERHLFHRI